MTSILMKKLFTTLILMKGMSATKGILNLDLNKGTAYNQGTLILTKQMFANSILKKKLFATLILMKGIYATKGVLSLDFGKGTVCDLDLEER